MKKVKCIHNTWVEDKLTYGKEYAILSADSSNSDTMITVLCDDNTEYGFIKKWHFIEVN
jgi:hypothetical protein